LEDLILGFAFVILYFSF